MYLSTNIYFLKMSGFYDLNSVSSKFLIKLLVFLWRWTIILNLFFSAIFVIMEGLNKDFKNIMGISLNILHSATYTCTVVLDVYLTVRWNGKGTKKVIDDANEVFEHETNTGFEEQNMKRADKFTYYFMMLWVPSMIGTCLLMIVKSIIFYANNIFVLPYPCWYIYDWTQLKYYILTLTLQSFTQFCLAISISNLVGLYVCSIYLTAQQFHNISWEIRHIFATSLLKYGYTKEEALTLNADLANISEKQMLIYETDKFRQIMLDNIKGIIKKHQIILKYSESLNTFFGPIWLHILGYVTFYLTFTSYNVFIGEGAAFLFEMFFYFLGGVANVSVFCLFGQILINGSESIYDAIYQVPWYLCNDKKLSNTILIMQLRAKKPSSIRAGYHFIVGFDLYIAMVKLVVSYFAVLKEVTVKDQEAL